MKIIIHVIGGVTIKPKIKYELKNRLKIARAETGETQEDLAKLIMVAKETYNQKELGKRDFTISECVLLAIHFEKDLDYLFMPNEVKRNELKKNFCIST